MSSMPVSPLQIAAAPSASSIPWGEDPTEYWLDHPKLNVLVPMVEAGQSTVQRRNKFLVNVNN